MWAPFREAPTGANDRPIAGYALGHNTPGAHKGHYQSAHKGHYQSAHKGHYQGAHKGHYQGAHKGRPYEGNAGNE